MFCRIIKNAMSLYSSPYMQAIDQIQAVWFLKSIFVILQNEDIYVTCVRSSSLKFSYEVVSYFIRDTSLADISCFFQIEIRTMLSNSYSVVDSINGIILLCCRSYEYSHFHFSFD